MIKIFVLTIPRYKDRWKKYDNRYNLFKGVDGFRLKETDEYMNKIKCRYNISLKQKQNVVGCLLSHLNIMRYIINNKLNNILVIEDDSIVDFDKLNELNINELPNELIYFGGIIRGNTLNNEFDYNNIIQNINNKINKIEITKFKIGATHGLFYPTWEVADSIYNYITSKDRIKAIDGEFALLQKENKINTFIFPAISYLDLKEARTGFSAKYGIPRDMKYY